MTRHAETVRANVRCILSAAKARGPGWRRWAPVYPDTTNDVRAVVGKDAFGCRADGAAALWWSDFRTVRSGVEEVRRGLWAPRNRLRLKGEAFNLITQAARIAAKREPVA